VDIARVDSGAFSFLAWQGDVLVPGAGQSAIGRVNFPLASGATDVTFTLPNGTGWQSETVNAWLDGGRDLDAAQLVLIDTATAAQYRYVQLPYGAFGGLGGASGAIGPGAGGAGGGAGSSGGGGTNPVPCHTNADCPQGTYPDRSACFILAPIGDSTTCATAPAGRCVSLGGINCLAFHYARCECLEDGGPTPYSQCMALGGMTCHGSTDTENDYFQPDSCFGCAPAPQSQ